jgi:hypothetical protein
MRRITTYVLVVVVLTVVVVSVAVGIGYYEAMRSPSPVPTASPAPTPTGSVSPTPTPTPNSNGLTTQEEVRDSVMSYVGLNHPETAQFMKDLVWTGGRVTPPNVLGAETYMYYSQGWNVTISYPVVPNPIYTVMADYSATSVGIPYRIVWQGTWQNGLIDETSYVFAQ